MRNFFIVLACSAFLSTPTFGAGRDQFEGKWTITVTSDEGGKPHDDTLVFKNGKFLSQWFKDHGFAEAEYEADVRGGQAATFTLTAKSTKEGSAKWSGTIAATQIQGTLTWTKADGSTVGFSFMGMRAEK